MRQIGESFGIRPKLYSLAAQGSALHWPKREAEAVEDQ